ncbi:MAG TPA: branched-chain amino acid ABC transporter permease [bacterium]|nr:branched-chain amino acid ABC transporter permease [bacterium]
MSGAVAAHAESPPSSDARPPLSHWWAVAGWVAMPLLAAALSHDRFTSSTLAAAGVQGLFAVSWVLLAATGQPSLGHALPYGAGAYAAAFVARLGGFHPGGLGGLVPVVLIAAAALAGAGAGALQGRVTRRLSPVFLAVATLGTAEAAHSLATMWTAPVMRGVAEADTAIPVAAFPNDDRAAVWIAAAAFGAGVLAVAALVHSRTGVALRTSAGEERAAEALGFDAPRLRLAAFVVAGTIAGVAGALAAQFSGRVSPAVFSWHTSLFVPAAALIGGPGLVAGPAAAAYVIGALTQFFEIAPGAQVVAFAAVLAAAALRDPQHALGPAFSWNPRPARGAGAPRRAPSRSARRDGAQ